MGSTETWRSHDIVIIGGGICGLATALALYRRGIKSVVLERSPTLRATGAAIVIQPNGWRALNFLGVAQTLEQNSIPIKSGRSTSVRDGRRTEFSFGGEVRCLRRMDIVNALAENLPADTVWHGQDVINVQVAEGDSSSIIQLHDGTTLFAKVVIGCDGVNSVAARTMNLNAMKVSATSVVRGLTHYKGHHRFNEFLLWTTQHVQLGLLPIDDKLVYWFLTRRRTVEDPIVSMDPELIKESTLASINGYPREAVDMVKDSDLSNLHLAELRYRRPWELLLTKRFRRGKMIVAGDAMHAMGPFLAQGGSASLEDAIVLAKCLDDCIRTPGLNHLTRRMVPVDPENRRNIRSIFRSFFKTMIGSRTTPSCAVAQRITVEDALEQYLEKRKMRIFWLSLQSDLVEMTVGTSPLLLRALSIFLLFILFGYQCGPAHFDPWCF